MKQKISKALLWVMVGIAVAWGGFLLVYLTVSNGPLEFWAWGVLAVITTPALVSVLVILGYIRHRLTAEKTESKRIVSRFSFITAVVFAVLALTVTVVRFLLDGFNIKYPWDYITLSSAIQNMGLAFGFITVISLIIGFIGEMIIRKMQQKNNSKGITICKTISVWLVSIIVVTILFVPQPMGGYNDGGSQKYESIFYEVIDWNRTQEFDGTPFHEENQKLRIYFFPFNCYEYEAKWEMKH